MTRRAWILWCLFRLPGGWGRRWAYRLLDRWTADAYQSVVVSRCFQSEETVTAETDEAGNLVFSDGGVVDRDQIVVLALGAPEASSPRRR